MFKSCCWALPLLLWSVCFAGVRPTETQEFAEARGKRVSNLAYDLELRFAKGRDAFDGRMEISFELADVREDLTIDFSGASVERVTINGVATKGYNFDIGKGGITLKAGVLKVGPQKIGIEFSSLYMYTGVGMHRYVDPDTKREYLYTDFQPQKANLAIPCFDQPDLRGTWRLETLAPTDWVAVSNAPVARHYLETVDGVEFKRTIFRRTKPFSTYLFNVCMGPYAEFRDDSYHIPLRLFCRQELAEHLDADAIFAVTKKGFDFFEDYFAIPYPFEKYDQIFAPEYNYGAMENPGSVVHTERSVFRTPPTKDRLTRRTDTIYHEQAHMWFGDLVTMKWWNDVWLNESFASYMANLALAGTGEGDAVENTSGSTSWAFAADQRPSSHPILVDVPDVETAASVFDGITYGKGLAVLQQLDFALGGTVFRDGVRAYLKKHAWSNTTLDDFTAALEGAAGRPLDQWVDLWLRTRDVNTMQLDFKVVDGKIQDAVVHQKPGGLNDVLRPHVNRLALYKTDAAGVPQRVKTIDLRFEKATQPVTELNGLAAPDFILPNQSAFDYIKCRFDSHSQAWLEANLSAVNDAEVRALVWDSWKQAARDGQLKGSKLTELFHRHMPHETRANTVSNGGEMIANLITSLLDEGPKRLELQKRMADTALALAKKQARGSDLQQAWLETFIYNARTEQHMAVLVNLFQGKDESFGPIRPMMRTFMLVALMRNKAPEATAPWADIQAGKDKQLDHRMIELIAGAVPTPEAKAESWAMMAESKTASLSDKMMRSRTFYDPLNPELGKPYVTRYFEYLKAQIKQGDFESLSRLARALFPEYQDEATLDAAKKFVQENQLETPLLNQLNDQIYEIERRRELRSQGF